jgi:ParB family chromosome partitioning protein
MAERVVAQGLNVRQTEALVQAEREPAREASSKKTKTKDANTAALERDLSARLGLKVAIDHGAKGGSLTLRYKTLDQLDDVIARLKAVPPGGTAN